MDFNKCFTIITTTCEKVLTQIRCRAVWRAPVHIGMQPSAEWKGTTADIWNVPDRHRSEIRVVRGVTGQLADVAASSYSFK